MTPEELPQLYAEGDRVRVVVLNVDVERKRMSLGMKQSYFDASEEVDAGEPDDANDEDAVAASEDADEDEDEKDAEDAATAGDSDMDEDAMEVAGTVTARANGRPANGAKPLAPLAVPAAGFDWGMRVTPSSAALDSPDEDEDDAGAGALALARFFAFGF